LIFIGDVHGRFPELRDRLLRFGMERQTLIQVGDFGVGFRPLHEEMRELAALDASLGEAGNTLYVIRGNHDNPAYFVTSSPLNLPHITFLEDYSLLEIDGRKLLLAGGAISIDRRVRREGVSYWRDEGFRLDLRRLEQLDLADLWAVVTHTAPTFVEPRELSDLVRYYLESDPELLQELREERQAVDRLYEAVTARSRPEYWLYGHFHAYANHMIEGTNFVLLNELQVYEVRPS
jgi:UDP-2,3-diacylglucosamine pyrophosphatase LpxH